MATMIDTNRDRRDEAIENRYVTLSLYFQFFTLFRKRNNKYVYIYILLYNDNLKLIIKKKRL